MSCSMLLVLDLVSHPFTCNVKSSCVDVYCSSDVCLPSLAIAENYIHTGTGIYMNRLEGKCGNLNLNLIKLTQHNISKMWESAVFIFVQEWHGSCVR